VPQPKLYDFELEEHRFCDFGMCQQKYKFFKPEPRLYEFELGEELEMKVLFNFCFYFLNQNFSGKME